MLELKSLIEEHKKILAGMEAHQSQKVFRGLGSRGSSETKAEESKDKRKKTKKDERKAQEFLVAFFQKKIKNQAASIEAIKYFPF